ncbi:MAG: hypothetical protein ACD_34C00597G0001 [uncultured bacterium]|nr:MAG: hypothetical protein ACD_34C00597G0001 [uncultured bacterium]
MNIPRSSAVHRDDNSMKCYLESLQLEKLSVELTATPDKPFQYVGPNSNHPINKREIYRGKFGGVHRVHHP